MKNQLMFPFNDKDKIFLYILKEVVDKLPECKNESRGRISENCEMATTFPTFLNQFEDFDYNIRRFVPFL
jgi:hypothetical protein